MEEVRGVGCSAAKAVSAAKVVDEDDEDEDKWTEDDDEGTDAGSRSSFMKKKWKLVVVWTNIDKEEAYRRAAVIMTDDFEVAGGPAHTWGEPSE